MVTGIVTWRQTVSNRRRPVMGEVRAAWRRAMTWAWHLIINPLLPLYLLILCLSIYLASLPVVFSVTDDVVSMTTCLGDSKLMAAVVGRDQQYSGVA